jgi:hypothetical protein
LKPFALEPSGAELTETCRERFWPLVTKGKPESAVERGFYHDGQHARKLKTGKWNEKFVNKRTRAGEKKGRVLE